MARKADLLFLKLAVKNQVLDEDQARIVLDVVERAQGGTKKARYVCVERGLIDEKTAKRLKKLVKEYLEGQAEAATKGKRIGNYAVEEKLGAGAMGIVYRARHVKLGRKVALKLLLPEFAQDEKYIERFEREARAAAQLNHPNIVSCFDAGSEDDVVYIAMEFVDGETVKELVDRDGPMDEKQAVEVVAQVAKALEHASEAGLMHRDVKPANIMLTAEGRAKLLDLGLAKKIEKEDDSNLTEAGRAIGTPYFMAPEQALDGTVDHRADLYSLGATLYYMLIGEAPFRAATPTGVLAKHVSEPVPSVRKQRPELTAGVEKVLARMLAKKPEDRYQKHSSLVSDLEDLASGLMPEGADESTPRSSAARKTRLNVATRSGARVPAGKKSSPMAFAGAIVGVGVLASVLVLRPSSAAPVVETTALARGVKVTADLYPASTKRPEEPALEVAAKPEASPLEQAAARQLEGALRSGKTGWELEALLDSVGRSHAGTQAGQDARSQAAALSVKLEAEEQVELTGAAPGLEELAKKDPLGAAFGYAAMADRFKGETAALQARERAGALEKRADDAALAADDHAQKLVAEGREDEAAKVLRDSLVFRRGAAKSAAQDRAAELERGFALKAHDAEEKTLASETQQVKALSVGLRDDVRSRHPAAARDAAQDALAHLTLDATRAKVAIYAKELAELAQLDMFAAKGFAALKGTQARVERRNAQPAEGTIKAVTDRGVSLEPRANVLVRVSFDEIDELALVVWIRRGKQLDEAKLHHLVAVVKAWRGDEDAILEANNVGDDELAAVAAELGPVDAVVASGAEPRMKKDEPAVSAHGNVAPAGAKGAPSEPPAAAPFGSDDRQRTIYENRSKLFPGATQSTFNGSLPVAWYDFTVANQVFDGLWRLEQGEAFSTPSGQERQGLSLRSGDGRALFDVPLTGQVRVHVDFVSYGTLAQDSRFSLVLEDSKKHERYESRFGVLHNEGRHKARQLAEPDDLLDRLKTNQKHTLDLELEGGKVTTRLDGKAMGELEAKDMGDVKAAIEWSHVTIHVLGVEVNGFPTDAYVTKQLASKK